jgi:UDP-2,4-diacetamido-2,4,6-trideoxy-beta-L-altropyranose hydrolase
LKKIILFRADASSDIGLGHVMRCLTLAKRLKKQDNSLIIKFATQNLSGNINLEIIKSGFEICSLLSNDKIEFLSLIKNLHPNLVILDSYEIGIDFEKSILSLNFCQVLSFDDMFTSHSCEMILNHGIQVSKNEYKYLASKDTKVLCGSKYTILRDEFFKSYTSKVEKKSVAILIGGNDVLNLSTKCVKVLKKIDPFYKITVITSGVNKNIEKLKIKEIGLLIDIDNIAEVLSSKSFVLCASGGTLFEVMALKKNFINLQVASNQQSIVNYLEKKEIKTTIKVEEISKKVLKKKIDYIFHNDIYSKLHLGFSKTKLAKKILKEIE